MGCCDLPENRRIEPPEINGEMSTAELLEQTFQAYNAGRLREACELFVQRYCSADTFVGMSLAGAMTPAGLGRSCVVPLMKNGWIDWVVSTGANLYHDLHFAMRLQLYRGSPFVDDRELHQKKIVRIYDIFFPEQVLFETDAYIREFCRSQKFTEPIGTARLHYEMGLQLLKDFPSRADYSILATAAKYKVPVYVSSPGDSGIGMNIAGLSERGCKVIIDPSIDVNETAALVYRAQSNKKKSAVLLIGGGSPKNFVLQTEPHLREINLLEVKGHDYFIQFTDARADTGGLSGATPSEAVSWGKVKEEQLCDSVVCYADATLCLPLLVAYACSKAKPKKHSGAYELRREAVENMIRDSKLPK
jgi:deoxyhypusine synthase